MLFMKDESWHIHPGVDFTQKITTIIYHKYTDLLIGLCWTSITFDFIPDLFITIHFNSAY